MSTAGFLNSEQWSAIQSMSQAFADQLIACLGECAHGRAGLFGQAVQPEQGDVWPEATRLRDLAVALQCIMNGAGERSALCDEYLDLCTMNPDGEVNTAEARLARTFLARIECGEVGSPTQKPVHF